MHLWTCVCITHSTGSVHASWTVLFHDWHRCGRIPAWPGTHTHLPYCSDRHQTHTRTQTQPHPRGEHSAGRVQSCSWPHSVTSDPETRIHSQRHLYDKAHRMLFLFCMRASDFSWFSGAVAALRRWQDTFTGFIGSFHGPGVCKVIWIICQKTWTHTFLNLWISWSYILYIYSIEIFNYYLHWKLYLFLYKICTGVYIYIYIYTHTRTHHTHIYILYIYSIKMYI